MSPVAPYPSPPTPRIDGLLVRRPLAAGPLRSLPVVPAGAEVTASVSDPATAIRHAAELRDRGYRPVGSAAAPADGGEVWVDFVVDRALCRTDERWVRLLIGASGRIYDPRLGPVQALLGPVLAVHGLAVRPEPR